MRNQGRTVILGLLMVFLMMGCAGTPKQMSQDDFTRMKRLAVVTSLSDGEFQVFDHTGIYERQYGGAAFGLLGGLIEGSIKAVQVNAATKASLGGEPDALKQELADFPVKEMFDENFAEVFSAGCEIITPREVEALGIDKFSKKENETEDYAPLCEKLGADTILRINFAYGLAAYKDAKASAAIIADVSVISMDGNKLLMKKRISSDDYYRNGYSIQEFQANGAELFKAEILKATRGLGHLVAAEFGIQLPVGEETISAVENGKEGL